MDSEEDDDNNIELQEDEVTDAEDEDDLPPPWPSGVNRFEMKSWGAIALCLWDIEVSICAICRNSIMDLCIECQANRENSSDSNGADDNAADDCKVVWGVCKHAFHYHCICRFLKIRPVCLLDNMEWQFLQQGT